MKSDKKSNDVEVNLLEEATAAAGGCGIESDEVEACVVCGIEGETELHPSIGSGDATSAEILQDNGSETTIEDNFQRNTSGCRPISISVRALSSSASDPNTHQPLSWSASIFNSSLETIFRQANSIRSGGNMRKFQTSCNTVQKSFLAEAWLQYRQEPRGMLAWLDSYMEKALDEAGWCEVGDIMKLLMASENEVDESDESDVNVESDESESE
jgi:hypothetical protein